MFDAPKEDAELDFAVPEAEALQIYDDLLNRRRFGYAFRCSQCERRRAYWEYD